MPLIGDFEGLKKLQRDVAGLARQGGSGQRMLLQGVVKEIRGLLKQQFATGTGPDGAPWKKTARGEDALISRKLPQDFNGKVVPGAARFSGHLSWMPAHQDGHSFAARQVGPHGQYLSFNKRGKLVSAKKIFDRKKMDIASRSFALKKGAYQTFAKAHKVGARILPQRQIYPDRGLTDRWNLAIGRGVSVGMDHWYAAAGK